jgi:hypothetical protein
LLRAGPDAQRKAGQARGDAVAVTHALVVCEADIYWVREPDCDSELAEPETGLVCPVDVDVEREPDCDAEVGELETELDSWADVAVVSAVPLGLTVTLEEEDENV